MGLYVPLVYLSKESLDHINQRHADVSDFDLIHSHTGARKERGDGRSQVLLATWSQLSATINRPANSHTGDALAWRFKLTQCKWRTSLA
jgi:hypothetical protein